MKVYNYSKCTIEPAKLIKCPCCKGDGWKDAYNDIECDICAGLGQTWQGQAYKEYYRPKFKPLKSSLAY